MLDLQNIALQLEEGKKFSVTFRLANSGDTQVMSSKLLDVAEDKGLIFVNSSSGIIWIDASEVLDIVQEE